MLHMTIAANVLNAIGGEPRIDTPEFIPEFPMNLPMTNVSVDIRPFDRRSVQNFMLIESVTERDKSIGSAYSYILIILKQISDHYGEDRVFTGIICMSLDN